MEKMMLKLHMLSHNHHSGRVKMLVKYIRRGISVFACNIEYFWGYFGVSRYCHTDLVHGFTSVEIGLDRSVRELDAPPKAIFYDHHLWADIKLDESKNALLPCRKALSSVNRSMVAKAIRFLFYLLISPPERMRH